MFMPSINNPFPTNTTSGASAAAVAEMEAVLDMVDMIVSAGAPGLDAATLNAMSTAPQAAGMSFNDLFLNNPDVRNELMQLFSLGQSDPAATEAGAKAFADGKSSYARVDVDGIFGDASLSQTDKLAIFLYAVLAALAQDEQDQAKSVGDLINQKGGGDTIGGNSKTVDVETMKLGRITDKRSQMLDLVEKIIEKRNESVDKVNQSRR